MESSELKKAYLKQYYPIVFVAILKKLGREEEADKFYRVDCRESVENYTLYIKNYL